MIKKTYEYRVAESIAEMNQLGAEGWIAIDVAWQRRAIEPMPTFGKAMMSRPTDVLDNINYLLTKSFKETNG